MAEEKKRYDEEEIIEEIIPVEEVEEVIIVEEEPEKPVAHHIHHEHKAAAAAPPRKTTPKKKKCSLWWWLLPLLLLLLALLLWKNCCGDKKACCAPEDAIIETTTIVTYIPLWEQKIAGATVDANDALVFPADGNTVDIDGVAYDKLSTEAEVYQFLTSEEKESGWIVLDAVHFKFNEVNFTDAALAQIKNVTAILNTYDPNAKLDIEGFADHIGTGKENQKISDERAVATQGHFVADGFDATKIVSAVGLKDTQRLCQADDTPVCRALNRRAEIKITR
jgi:outer membrane protein OmpA-like peptidoglycan-associated protein